MIISFEYSRDLTTPESFHLAMNRMPFSNELARGQSKASPFERCERLGNQSRFGTLINHSGGFLAERMIRAIRAAFPRFIQANVSSSTTFIIFSPVLMAVLENWLSLYM